MEEFVILVDGNDNPIGREEKTKCHLPDGKLHRAFTALLFDRDNRLVLTKRAAQKMLWPGYWDGTFASHPREGETYVSSGERRMPEELGVSGKLDYMNKFEYHVPYKDVGSENEICATLVGIINGDAQLQEVEGEIDGIKRMSAAELLIDIKSDPKPYCPWMLIALYYMDRSKEDAPETHAGIISAWTGKEMHDGLLGAIAAHLPDDKWRLLDEKD